MIINYMYKDEVQTQIFFDEESKKVKINNYTNDILHRAFGVNESPNYEDLITFLKDRCWTKSRGDINNILSIYNLAVFDLIELLKQTNGRTYEDDLYMEFINKK